MLVVVLITLIGMCVSGMITHVINGRRRRRLAGQNVVQMWIRSRGQNGGPLKPGWRLAHAVVSPGQLSLRRSPLHPHVVVRVWSVDLDASRMTSVLEDLRLSPLRQIVPALTPHGPVELALEPESATWVAELLNFRP